MKHIICSIFCSAVTFNRGKNHFCTFVFSIRKGYTDILTIRCRMTWKLGRKYLTFWEIRLFAFLLGNSQTRTTTIVSIWINMPLYSSINWLWVKHVMFLFKWLLCHKINQRKILKTQKKHGFHLEKKYSKDIRSDLYCIYFILIPMSAVILYLSGVVTGYFVVTVSHGLFVSYSKAHEGREELY